MFEIIQKLIDFSGKHSRDLKRAFGWGMLYSFFEVIPILAIILALEALTLPREEISPAAIALPCFIILASIAGKILTGKKALDLRMTTSYRICADKRLEAGEMLKRVPLGYFNENRLGEFVGSLTTSLGEIENLAVPVVDKMASGFVHAVLISIVIALYDWQVGLVTVLALLLSFFVFTVMQRQSGIISPKRHTAQMRLVGSVLEYIQGMAVVKAFGLAERSQKDIDRAIDDSCHANVTLERSFSLLIAAYQLVFKAASVAVLLIACLQYFAGTIALSKCLALLTASFMLYAHIEMLGSVSAVARAIAHSLDRMAILKAAPLMDVDGRDVIPENYEIRFENVSFAYGDKRVLHDINAVFLQGALTAIVGPSGSGKTTLCNLAARFWDVSKGTVFLGNRDVKEYSCESLLKNISMVFQNVYLFEDSIRNNIAFGKPGASREEIEEAARRAACHDFIVSLPDGYDTMVGEGGGSLSGGERQRISIARAILKDAPVIILDEATASLDPENEQQVQQALGELVKNKTVVMIAHRLATVRNANQILVIDQGRIIQRGTHDELLQQGGLYKEFVKVRESAENWVLQS